MNRLLSSLPVWVILADMVYTFVLSILQSLNLTQSSLPKDGLPVAPDIAFSGLQVVANGGMALIIFKVRLQIDITIMNVKASRSFT